MWQTKYASAVPKDLGLGFDFRPYSEGDFLTGRLLSVQAGKIAEACCALRLVLSRNGVEQKTLSKLQ